MSSWKLVDIKDIKDLGDGTYEMRFLGSGIEAEHAQVGYIRLHPGSTKRPHKHKLQEEVYILVEGEVEAKLDDKTIDMKAESALKVPPAVVRSFHNKSDSDALLVAVGAPETPSGDSQFVD
jgi:quercetin dioxygenase-like cupin family protein